MNKIILAGNLGHAASVRDVAKRDGGGSTAVVNFTLAVRLGWGEREVTQWWECAWWGERAAKVSQWLPKGRQVLIEGEADMETFVKRDGTAGAKLVCTVRDLKLIGGRSEGSGSAAGGGGERVVTVAAGEGALGGKAAPAPVLGGKEDVPF